MNHSSAARTKVVSKPGNHLLDTIRTIRVEVGDGLSDDEFTWLLQQDELPVETGFAFLCYCERFVTLSVPYQELADWYPEKGWIMSAKERIARTIAEKYGLSLCEPPDMQSPWLGSSNPHHHLQLSYQQESVIVIHPQYLKICLFIATSPTQPARISHKPLLLGPDLLPDLSKLYQV
ncbi:MAG: hypothetical protein JWR19_2104 [Pedosphaera sp.]|nr:hypothetical protein [Pedosphaera sp.]